MAEKLLGKAVAARLNEEIARDVEELAGRGVVPTLAIVRVGENESDLSYERGALKRCEALGVAYKKFVLAEDVTTEEVLSTIAQINEDRSLHGCLLFRPLPGQLDAGRIENALLPSKDVDCMTEGSIGAVFTGKALGYPPCTPQACMEILKHYGYALKGKRVVVIGRSLVVGKPVAMMCLKENATVTICHTKTEDMPAVCRQADILIVAAGRPRVIGAEYVSAGQVVIDVGINMDENGALCGDVDYDAAEGVVGAITPVPGGVGAATTAVLVKHVVDAAKKAAEV